MGKGQYLLDHHHKPNIAKFNNYVGGSSSFDGLEETPLHEFSNKAHKGYLKNMETKEKIKGMQPDFFESQECEFNPDSQIVYFKTSDNKVFMEAEYIPTFTIDDSGIRIFMKHPLTDSYEGNKLTQKNKQRLVKMYDILMKQGVVIKGSLLQNPSDSKIYFQKYYEVLPPKQMTSEEDAQNFVHSVSHFFLNEFGGKLVIGVPNNDNGRVFKTFYVVMNYKVYNPPIAFKTNK
jgi:hypothetical protein